MNAVFDFIEQTWAAMHPGLRALLALGLGWVAAMLARLIVTGLLKLFKAERLSDKLGVTEFFRKGGVQYSVIQFFGAAAFWLVMGVSLVVVSAILDISVVTDLWARTAAVIPGLVASALILVIGILVVSFFANFALTIARNAGSPNAQLISKAIRYAGILVVALIAIDQLGLGGNILSVMLLTAFGALMLGLAIAFGLGCKDLARAAMERFLKDLRERGRAARPTDMEG